MRKYILLIFLYIIVNILIVNIAYAKIYFEGDTEKFFVKNFIDNKYYEKEATLVIKGENCYLFVENGIVLTENQIAKVFYEFESNIYPTVRYYFGTEWSPGIDGDTKIFILITDIKDKYETQDSTKSVKSFFDKNHELTKNAFQYSNEKEILFLDSNPAFVGSKESLSALAYSFQHMVHWFMDSYKREPGQEHIWITRGFGLLAGFLCGYGHPQKYVDAYLNNTLTVLAETDRNKWTDANFGASYLFALYCYEKFGKANFTRTITSYSEDGIYAMQKFFKSRLTTFEKVFRDFAIAIYLDDERAWYKFDKKYWFENIDVNAKPYIIHSRYPVIDKKVVIPYTGILFTEFTSGLDNKLKLEVHADVSEGNINVDLIKQNGFTPEVENLFVPQHAGALYYLPHFGRDYTKLTLCMTNTKEFTNADWVQYTAAISGPPLIAFLNPVFKNQLVINVKSIGMPKVFVKQQGRKEYSYVSMHENQKYFWAGSYLIDKLYPGDAFVRAEGIPPGGKLGETIWYFKVYSVKPEAIMKLESPDAKWEIIGRARSTSTVITYTNPNSSYKELIPLTSIFSIIGTSPFCEGIIRYKDYVEKGELYKKQGDRWVFIKKIDTLDMPVAKLRDFGDYAIFNDETPPAVKKVIFKDDILQVEVVDNGSGVNKDEIYLLADSKRLSPVESKENMYIFRVLNKDELLELTVKDKAGNLLQKPVNLTGNFEFKIEQSFFYPNPANSTATLKIKLSDTSLKPESINLKIYDSAAYPVNEFNITSFTDNYPEYYFTWNLENKKSRTVSNGVYFFKLKLCAGEKIIERTGKLAILR